MAETVGNTAESTNDKQVDSGNYWEEEGYTEPLDMDGNPYFDPPGPIDWNKHAANARKNGFGDRPSEFDEEEKTLGARMQARDFSYEYQG